MGLAIFPSMKPQKQSATEKLVELYYQPVFRFAARLCGSPERAIVLTLRTFRVATERSQNLPVPNNVRGWLITILFHQFLQARPRRISFVPDFVSPNAVSFAS